MLCRDAKYECVLCICVYVWEFVFICYILGKCYVSKAKKCVWKGWVCKFVSALVCNYVIVWVWDGWLKCKRDMLECKCSLRSTCGFFKRGGKTIVIIATDYCVLFFRKDRDFVDLKYGGLDEIWFLELLRIIRFWLEKVETFKFQGFFHTELLCVELLFLLYLFKI